MRRKRIFQSIFTMPMSRCFFHSSSFLLDDVRPRRLMRFVPLCVDGYRTACPKSFTPPRPPQTSKPSTATFPKRSAPPSRSGALYPTTPPSPTSTRPLPTSPAPNGQHLRESAARYDESTRPWASETRSNSSGLVGFVPGMGS